MTPPTIFSIRNLGPALVALGLLVGRPVDASSIYSVTNINLSNDLQLNNAGQVAGLRGSDGFLYSNGQYAPLTPGIVPVALADNGRVIDGRGPAAYYSGELLDRDQVNVQNEYVGDQKYSATAAAGNHNGVLVGTGFQSPYANLGDRSAFTVGYIYQPNPNSAKPYYSGQFLETHENNNLIYLNGSERSTTPIPGDPTGQGYSTSLGWKVLPTAINDHNQIVGSAANVDPHYIYKATPYHAFLESSVIHANQPYPISPQGSVDLGTLGGNESGATGINNAGQVIGWANTASGAVHAFLYTSGKMLDLGVLSGKLDFVASALDNQGDVVGTSGGHAFLFTSGGIMEDLNDRLPATSGLTLDKAIAINDVGQILAEGHGADGVEHAVLLSPVPTPEPTTLALFGLAAVGYGVRRRVRGSRGSALSRGC